MTSSRSEDTYLLVPTTNVNDGERKDAVICKVIFIVASYCERADIISRDPGLPDVLVSPPR